MNIGRKNKKQEQRPVALEADTYHLPPTTYHETIGGKEVALSPGFCPSQKIPYQFAAQWEISPSHCKLPPGQPVLALIYDAMRLAR